MRSVACAVFLAAAAFSLMPGAGAQASVEGVSVAIQAPGDPVVPLGESIDLTVEVTTECVDEDLQPMTQTEVGITWNRPAPYVTVNGSQVSESHAKDSVGCASGGDEVTSTLTFTVTVAPDAPGFAAFDVAVTAVMNKTTVTGTTTQYGPATGNVTLFTGFRSGLHVLEIPSDSSVKPGNETTLQLRVFNLANAAARVTIEEAPGGGNNSTTMRVLSLPEAFTLDAAGNESDDAYEDVEIRLEAPAEVPGPGYHPATVTLRFTTTTQTPNGPAETEDFEETFTRYVGGEKVDVYTPSPSFVGMVAVMALALAVNARRK